MRKAWSLVALCVLIAPHPSGAAVERPRDYTEKGDLTKPVYKTIVHESYKIPMRDHVRLYVEVWRPKGVKALGTILELSPYNGGLERRGYLPSEKKGLSGYFAPRGYAVALADLRGTGNSEGCMDYMGPVDRLDAYDLVEWLGTRSWSNGRVGMAGVSYVGTTPTFAASMEPPHLKTIVPVAGLGQIYDHEFQAGVPYNLQWVGVMGYYDATAKHPADQTDPGWARNTASFGCGIPNSSIPGSGADAVTGRYTTWHAARDFRDEAAGANVLPD